MAPKCPFCDRRIRLKDVDFQRDAAPCRACGKVVAFSSLPGVANNPSLQRLLERLELRADRSPSNADAPDAAAGFPSTPRQGAHRPATAAGVDISQPPPGAWYRDDGVTLELGASTRSIGLAILMTLIGGFW